MNFDNEKLIEAFGTDEQKEELAERKERLDTWLKGLAIPVITEDDIGEYLARQISGVLK